MKSQVKTILLFLIYVVLIFGFCYWYKDIAKLHESKKWIDLGPILRYMLFSAIINSLFFFCVKIMVNFSIDQFSYLTTRAIAFGLIFYIIGGWIIPTSFDEYYLFTSKMGLATLFVLIKEKLIFAKANTRMRTT